MTADPIWDFDWDDWVEAGYPMTGPAFDWSGIRYITIHWPGAPRVLVLTFDAERGEIRSEQRMYTDDPNRGYSLGYNAKVFQDGSKWMLRGDVLRCAANGSQALNVPGFAIQIRVAIGEEPTQALIDSVRELVAWCRKKAGRHLPVNGHRDLKATQCPGDRAYQLIQQGVFEPVEHPVVVDPNPIFPEVPTVANAIQYAIYKPTDCDAQFLGLPDEDGNTLFVVWVDKQRADAWQSVGVQVYDQLSLGGFINCVLFGRIPTGDTRHSWSGAEFFQVVA